MNYRTRRTGNWRQQMETKEHAITDLLVEMECIAPGGVEVYEDNTAFLGEPFGYIGLGPDFDKRSEGVLLVAIMQAIEAQGWHWSVAETPFSYTAVIESDGGEYPGPRVSLHTSPAHALLLAFITALREVKEDE